MMMLPAVLTAKHYKNELLGKGHINLLTQFSGDMKAEIRLFRRLNDFGIITVQNKLPHVLERLKVRP